MTPKGGRDRIEGWQNSAAGSPHLKVRVSAPPEKGKANQALIALLARELDIPKSLLAIRSGDTGRLKKIEALSDADALAAKLDAIGEAK